MIKFLGRLLAALVVGLAILWAAGALYYDLPAPSGIRQLAAVIWLLAAFVAWFWLRPRRWSRSVVAVVFVCILGWWLSIRPNKAGIGNPTGRFSQMQ